MEGFARLGYPQSLVLGIGTLEFACSGLCDYAHLLSRRDLADRLSRRRDRFTRPHRRSSSVSPL